MKSNLKVYGEVKQGTLSLNRKRLVQSLMELKDGDYELLLKRRGKRSNQSLRYYWGVLVEEIRIEFERRGTHLDAEQVHEFLKFHFNKQYIHGENGEVLSEYGGSTTEFNQEMMGEYMERIIIWCSEKLEITISAPGEQTELFTNHKAA